MAPCLFRAIQTLIDVPSRLVSTVQWRRPVPREQTLGESPICSLRTLLLTVGQNKNGLQTSRKSFVMHGLPVRPSMDWLAIQLSAGALELLSPRKPDINDYVKAPGSSCTLHSFYLFVALYSNYFRLHLLPLFYSHHDCIFPFSHSCISSHFDRTRTSHLIMC